MHSRAISLDAYFVPILKLENRPNLENRTEFPPVRPPVYPIDDLSGSR